MATKDTRPPLEIVIDRLLVEAEKDSDVIANLLTGGDFTVDATKVTGPQEAQFRAEHWPTDPKNRQEWADSVLDEEFLRKSLATMAPDFDPKAAEFWIECIEAGIPVMQAIGMANQMDRTLKAQAQIRQFGAMPVPEPMAAPPMALMAPAPPPMAAPLLPPPMPPPGVA